MGKTTAERRAHARFPKSFSLETMTEPVGAVARMSGSNLSLGGLYCSSAADFPEMTRLAVVLALPVGTDPIKIQPINAEAVVIRRRKLNSSSGDAGYELGLFFNSMSDMDRERLARYLASP